MEALSALMWGLATNISHPRTPRGIDWALAWLCLITFFTMVITLCLILWRIA